jgi:hypothetical protein
MQLASDTHGAMAMREIMVAQIIQPSSLNSRYSTPRTSALVLPNFVLA